MPRYEENLWGQLVEIPDEPVKTKTKKIMSKIKTPKDVSESTSIKKQVTSKKLNINDKLALIKTEVFRILGKQ